MPGRKPARDRRGSLFVVIMVAAVLGILGGVAVMMSTSFGRTSYHEKLVYDAETVAREAVEEASLLINNGEADVEIVQAVNQQDSVKIAKVGEVDGSKLKDLKDEGKCPDVYVKATVINDQTWRTSARNQVDQMVKNLENFGDMDGAAYQDALAFLKRMQGDHADYNGEGLVQKDTGEYTGAALAEKGQGSPFWSNLDNVGVSHWQPRFQKNDKDSVEAGEDCNGDGLVDQNDKKYKWYLKPNMPDPMKKLFLVFYDDFDTAGAGDGYYCSAPPVNGGNKRATADKAALKAAWNEAITYVAIDAAKKVESCGGNPALAMAHLVGDLKKGEKIASGAEVSETRNFLVDKSAAAKTYLVEITSAMGYEGHQGRQSGSTAFRSYRILQKIEWEEIMLKVADNVARDMVAMGSGVTAADFAQLWPPRTGQKGRDEPLGTGGTRWDPTAFIADPVYEQLPSTVGSRLYPYGVGTVSWNPDQAEKTDAAP